MSGPVLVQRPSPFERMTKTVAVLLGIIVSVAALGSVLLPSSARAAPPSPVYIHMNGANEFLERLVFVRPEQKVVFVNEDTGPHAIRGYDQKTGVQSKTFYKPVIMGTPGAQHPPHTYTISFPHQGAQHYYCPVHAYIAKGPGGVWLPVRRPTTHGFGAAMAGTIVVTDDKALLADNPKTASKKILPNFFGG
jgi:plastocyanin